MCCVVCREGVATSRLARLYREDGEDEKAALCYQKHLTARGRQQVQSIEKPERKIKGKTVVRAPSCYKKATSLYRRVEHGVESTLGGLVETWTGGPFSPWIVA